MMNVEAVACMMNEVYSRFTVLEYWLTGNEKLKMDLESEKNNVAFCGVD